MADEIVVVFSTFPDVETARRIARELIDDKFAACANVISKIESIYRWQGKLEQGEETLVFFKTSAARYPAFQEKLKSLHPYEVPEIVCIPVSAGWPAYLGWVAEGSR